MNKKQLSERDICTKFITPAVQAGRLGRDDADPRGGQLHQGPHHRPRQAGHARQGQARRLHPLLQAEHPASRSSRPRTTTTASATACSRRSTTPTTLDIPFVFSSNGDGFVFHDRTGAERRDRRPTSRSTPSRRPPISGRGIAPGRASTPEAEQIVLQDYFDDGSGKAPRYYQAQRRQRRDRGHRQGPGPHPAGHGDRHRQDLHRLPDHLAAVEGRAARSASSSSPTATCSIDQTMVNDFRPFGAAMAKLSTSAKTIERDDGTDGRPDDRARQEAPHRHRLRDLSRPLSGDHRPGGAAEAVPRVLARLLRPDRHRRVPPRQRRRGFGLARDPRLLLRRPRRSA